MLNEKIEWAQWGIRAEAAAVTVMACFSVPVPPPKLSMAAAYNVAVVVAVTVGAVQLNVQL